MGMERHARLFEKGDLKFVILDLLKDKPGHGYEMIRALEERFHGFYSPSAGSVYPTLQLLEDLGYVKLTEADGKKVYNITEDGKKFLEERAETIDKIKGHMGHWCHTGKHKEFQETFMELRKTVQLLRQNARQLDDEKLSKIKEIISRACRDIEAVVS